MSFYRNIFDVNSIYLEVEEIKSSVLMNDFLYMSAQVPCITLILQLIISVVFLWPEWTQPQHLPNCASNMMMALGEETDARSRARLSLSDHMRYLNPP